MYVLLSGRLPFEGQNNDEIIEKIKTADYNFQGEQWRRVTNAAQDLIRCMLNPNPELRYTAYQAYNHAWIQNNFITQSLDRSILDNIQNFSAKTNFRSQIL